MVVDVLQVFHFGLAILAEKSILNMTVLIKTLFDVFRCISLGDQLKSLQFAYRRDVKSFLAARLLVLYATKHCLSIDSALVNVQRDADGRPYVMNSSNFDFNLSHNGDFTLLTSCQNMRTGVDVMRVELPPASTSVDSFIHKMNSLFSSSEFYWLTFNSNKETKIRRFFRLWCLKEAFVKNTGTGLRMDVSSVEFDLTGDKPKCNFPGLVSEEWSFEEHSLPLNHVAAIAWHKPGQLL
nr:L aminoadipate semialdehyde [Hymenolepis microstoma]